MALTFPLDFLLDFPGWTTRFELMRRQEQSRQAGGITQVKDLGDPLWMGAWQSRTLWPNELDRWKATLQSLEEGIQQFKGRPLSRCYPILYPNGSWPTGGSFSGTSGELHTVAGSRKAIRVDALPDGFTLSIGDYVQIGDADLHQVVESAMAATGGLTPSFEIRPHVWPGVTGGGSPPPAVSVKQPYCLMTMVPGSLSAEADPQTGRGVVTFQGIESR